MNLDLVPQREAGMSAYEMMLSESQERMLVVVEKGKEAEAIAIFDKWGLASAVVGKVTEDSKLRLLHKGEVVAEVPVDSLADDAPVYHRPSAVPAYYEANANVDVIAGITERHVKNSAQRVLNPVQRHASTATSCCERTDPKRACP